MTRCAWMLGLLLAPVAGADELAPQTRALLHQALEARLTLPTEAPSLQRPVLPPSMPTRGPTVDQHRGAVGPDGGRQPGGPERRQRPVAGEPGERRPARPPGTRPARRGRRRPGRRAATAPRTASHPGRPGSPRTRPAKASPVPEPGRVRACGGDVGPTPQLRSRRSSSGCGGRGRREPPGRAGARAAARSRAGTPSASEPHLVAGAEAFRAEAYAQALVEFRVAEALGSAEARWYSAASLLKLGRAEDAVEAFVLAERSSPSPRATPCSRSTAVRPATRRASTSARTAGSSPPRPAPVRASRPS